MQVSFSKQLFIKLTFEFAITSIAGTLLHECGHYIAAKMLGYQAKISYASTHWDDPVSTKFLDNAYTHYDELTKYNQSFPNKEKVRDVEAKKKSDTFYITLAGPVQTMLTGCIGLVLVLFFQKKYNSTDSLSLLQWLSVFLSLFWSRQIFNFIVGMYAPSLKAIPALQSDEVKLALYLHWPTWSISFVTACVGLAVSLFIFLKIISAKTRATYLLAGICGGLGGFILWAKYLGPLLLPYPAS